MRKAPLYVLCQQRITKELPYRGKDRIGDRNLALDPGAHALNHHIEHIRGITWDSPGDFGTAGFAGRAVDGSPEWVFGLSPPSSAPSLPSSDRSGEEDHTGTRSALLLSPSQELHEIRQLLGHGARAPGSGSLGFGNCSASYQLFGPELVT